MTENVIWPKSLKITIEFEDGSEIEHSLNIKELGEIAGKPRNAEFLAHHARQLAGLMVMTAAEVQGRGIKSE